jgi:hypothetical protein
LFRRGALLKSQFVRKKDCPFEKKLLTIETDLSMLSVWLQRRFYSAATLVFENRIAVCVVIASSKLLSKSVNDLSKFFKLSL